MLDKLEIAKKKRSLALQKELQELISEYNQIIMDEVNIIAALPPEEQEKKGFYAIPKELYLKDLFYLNKISNFIWTAQAESFEPELLADLYNISFIPYDLVLFESLPDKDKAKAEKGKIYLRDDGYYVVHNFEGKIFEGYIDTKESSLKDLDAKIADPALKKRMLQTVKTANHILNPFQYDLEMRLQLFGIHRDASIFLQNYEFAEAVNRIFVEDKPSYPKDLSLYEVQKLRTVILQAKPSDKILDNYVKFSLAYAHQANNDDYLIRKIAAHKHIIGLSHGKIEAIQGQLQAQKFKEYKTKVLGSSVGNNRNFKLELDKNTKPVVVRVEDRDNLSNEATLQMEEVSKYFTEDYATFLLPMSVKEGEDEEETIRPVVISELASHGSLEDFAVSLKGSSEEVISQKAQNFFKDIDDFCELLIKAKHFHSDIKLSNFLTDGNRIIISDRKYFLPENALIDEKNGKEKKKILARDMHSTISYAAPEWASCLEWKPDKKKFELLPKASTTTIELPEYMSFQLGMALKEFVLLATGIITKEAEMPIDLLANQIKNPTKELRNLSLLVGELTRSRPEDRLSISNFKILLGLINLEPHKFLEEVDKLNPVKNLSNAENINAIRQLKAQAKDPTDEFLEKVKNLPPKIILEPRAQPIVFPEKEISIYLKTLNQSLTFANFKAASFRKKVLYIITFGFYALPQTQTLASLGEKLPKVSKTLELSLRLYAKADALGILHISGPKALLVDLIKFKGLSLPKALIEAEEAPPVVASKNTIFSSTIFKEEAPILSQIPAHDYKPITGHYKKPTLKKLPSIKEADEDIEKKVKKAPELTTLIKRGDL